MLRRILKKIYRRINGKQKQTPSYTPPTMKREKAKEEKHIAEESEEEVDLEVEASQVLSWIDEGKTPLLVDIRQPYELRSGYIPDALLVPMNQLASQYEMFPKDIPIVLYCAAGARSFGMAHFMREKGYEQAWSMIGGVGEWPNHAMYPEQTKFNLLDEVKYKEKTMIVMGANRTENEVVYLLQESGTISLEKDVEEKDITS